MPSNAPASPAASSVVSPCIRVCTLDDHHVCIGCGRHVDEITRWTLMTRDEQSQVLALSEQRRARRENLLQEVMKRGTDQRR